MVTQITTATTNAQNAQTLMAKHVVTVGHAWSQTSQRRSQMRKTPKPQWQNALWPWVTHGHEHHNCDHKARRARGSGSRMVTNITTAAIDAQNTQAPEAKRVVALGHAWSQTSQLRPQGAKGKGKCRRQWGRGATKTIGKTGGPEAFQEKLQNGRTLFIPPHCTVEGINQGPPGVGFRQPDWGRGLGIKRRQNI